MPSSLPETTLKNHSTAASIIFSQNTGLSGLNSYAKRQVAHYFATKTYHFFVVKQKMSIFACYFRKQLFLKNKNIKNNNNGSIRKT